jgi:hypothetical protein
MRTTWPARKDCWPSLPASARPRTPAFRGETSRQAPSPTEAAAAEGSDDDVEGADLLDEFLRRRALTGDDVVVVVRRKQG